MTAIANPPINDSLIEVEGRHGRPSLISKGWAIWLQNSLIPRTQSGSQLLATKVLTGRTASLPVTPFTLGTITQGLYQLSWYSRVTVAAGTNSSLIHTFSWTETGVSVTESGPANTTNNITLPQSGSFRVQIDAGSPIAYSTTYVSAGVPSMTYLTTLTVEKIS